MLLCVRPRWEGQMARHHVLQPHNKGLVILEHLDLAKFCESPTVLRLVGAGFARSYGLYEVNRFVLISTNNCHPFLHH